MSLNTNYNNEMTVECKPGPRNACGPWKVSEDATLLPPDDPRGIEVFTEVGYFGIPKNYKGNTPEKGGLKSSEQIYTEVNKNYKLIPRNNEFNDQRQVIYFRPTTRRFPLKEGKIPTFEELNPIGEHEEYKNFESIEKYEKYVDTLNIKNIYKKVLLDKKPMFTIKVDPENTYIYNQGYRLVGSWMGHKINARDRYDECRMKLSDYINAQFEYEKAKKTLDDIYKKIPGSQTIGEAYKEAKAQINWCGVDDETEKTLKDIYLRKKDSRRKEYEDKYEEKRLETIEKLKKEILTEFEKGKTYEELKEKYKFQSCKKGILDFIIVKHKVNKIDGLEEAIKNVWKAEKNFKGRMCGPAADNEIIIKTPLIGPEWFVKTNYYVVPKINFMKQEKAIVASASDKPNNNAMLIETSSVAPKNIVLVAAPSKKSTKSVASASKPTVLRTKDDIMKNIAILEANIGKIRSERQKKQKQDILETLKAELAGMSGGNRKTRKHSKSYMCNRKTRRLK
jgi:hypothetical protein